MNTKPLEVLHPQRRHIRLSSYDYTWQGAYFVTICTYEKQCLFGHVEEGSIPTEKSSNYAGKISLFITMR